MELKADTPNLWPTDIKLDVQSPLGILETQAGLLSHVTRGLLHAIVETETTGGTAEHRLVIVAPGYNQYRHVLLVAKHAVHLPYPTTLVNDALAVQVRRDNVFSIQPVYETVYPCANTDDELIEHLRRALGSGETKAVVLALIAKSNEPRPRALSAADQRKAG